MDFDKAREQMICTLQEFLKVNETKSEPVHHIINIIDKGVLILDYQMGCNLCEYRDDNMYYIYKERAYIKGFMRHREGYNFINWINSNTNMIAYFIHGDTSERFEEEYYGKDVSRTPTIIVSLEGLSETEAPSILIPKKKIPTVLVKSSIDYDKTRAHLLASEDVSMIICIDPNYGRENQLYIDMIHGCDILSSYN